MRLRKNLIVVIAVFIIATVFSPFISVSSLSYQSYNYNAWDESVPVPDSYEPIITLTGEESGAGAYKAPSDLFISEDGKIYISDTENNRIVILDSQMKFIDEIKQVEQDGVLRPLKKPSGIFKDNDGKLYICEQELKQVTVISENGKVTAKYVKPESELISDSLDFLPSKVLVNDLGMVYVLIEGYYMGALTYDADGTFRGFFGSNEVEVTLEVLVNSFWKKIFSEEQKDKLSRYVPIQYSNFDIDKDGFIYTCTRTTKTSRGEIKKLNALSNNVLIEKVRNTGVKGDYGDIEVGWLNAKLVDTQFVDICVDDNGFINALDYARGRIFQYDQKSELLMVFGTQGSQQGAFKSPCALDTLGEKIIVLDSATCQITVFAPTAHGSKIREAVICYENGDYKKSGEIWKELSGADVNGTLCYDGLGKTAYEEQRYEDAMVAYKKAFNRSGYSKAYKEVRSAYIRKALPWFVSLVAVILIALWVVAVRLKKRRPAFAEYTPSASYSKRICRMMVYSVDELQEMKFAKDFRVKAALISLLCWLMAAISQRQLTGFIFNYEKAEDFNFLIILLSTIGVFLLVVIANWAVSTFLDGKGSFKEIFVSLSFALIPYTIASFISTFFSNFLLQDEGVFLKIIVAIGIIWSAYLVISVMIAVHHYSFSKSIFCLLFTAAGVLFVLFLIFLFFGLIQQVTSFVATVYNEIMFHR